MLSDRQKLGVLPFQRLNAVHTPYNTRSSMRADLVAIANENRAASLDKVSPESSRLMQHRGSLNSPVTTTEDKLQLSSSRSRPTRSAIRISRPGSLSVLTTAQSAQAASLDGTHDTPGSLDGLDLSLRNDGNMIQHEPESEDKPQIVPTSELGSFSTDEGVGHPLCFEHTPTLPVPERDSMVLDAADLIGSPETVVNDETPSVQAFAKLEFDDGVFYMNTNAIILGRDVRAQRQADREEDAAKGDDARSGRLGRSNSSRQHRAGQPGLAGSILSESGGIMGTDGDKVRGSRRSGRGSKRSWSSESSSNHPSRQSAVIQPSRLFEQHPLLQSGSDILSEGIHPLDPLALVPSPDECPTIPIHPPPSFDGKYSMNSISRKHVKVQYNSEDSVWEMHVQGKNGAFLDEDHYDEGSVVVLRSGSEIQIGGVSMRFLLPCVEIGSTGGEEYDSRDSDDECSDQSIGLSDDEPSNSRAPTSNLGSDDEDADDEHDRAGQESDTSEVPKRRRPGRPRKISRPRTAEEIARSDPRGRGKKKSSPEIATLAKGKIGRPKKEPKEEPESLAKPKRPYNKTGKYSKANLALRRAEQGLDKSKLDDATLDLLSKERRIPRAPRSPSPVYDESKMTPEQLAKPSSSYVVLIFEAIQASKTGALSLPQIYRAIERKYPYYKLRVTTNGWQSSVRHNLSQHAAFQKIERDGKGWMWGLVPGVSIERERRRRPSPPPSLASNLQSPAQPMPQNWAFNGSNGTNLTKPNSLPVSYPTSSSPASSAKPGTAWSNGLPSPNPSILRPLNSMSPLLGRNSSANGYTQPPRHDPSPLNPYALRNTLPPLKQPSPNPSSESSVRQLTIPAEFQRPILAFQQTLIDQLRSTNLANAEQIVNSAFARVFGSSKGTTMPDGQEHTHEKAVMKAVQDMLQRLFDQKRGEQAQGHAYAYRPDSASQQMPRTRAKLPVASIDGARRSVSAHKPEIERTATPQKRGRENDDDGDGKLAVPEREVKRLASETR